LRCAGAGRARAHLSLSRRDWPLLHSVNTCFWRDLGTTTGPIRAWRSRYHRDAAYTAIGALGAGIRRVFGAKGLLYNEAEFFVGRSPPPPTRAASGRYAEHGAAVTTVMTPTPSVLERRAGRSGSAARNAGEIGGHDDPGRIAVAAGQSAARRHERVHCLQP